MAATLTAPNAHRLHADDVVKDRDDLLQLKARLEAILRDGVWVKPPSLISLLLHRPHAAKAAQLTAKDRARFTRTLADVDRALQRLR